MGGSQSSPCKFTTSTGNSSYYLLDNNMNVASCELEDNRRYFLNKSGCTNERPCMGSVRPGTCKINGENINVRCAAQEVNGAFLPVTMPEELASIQKYFDNPKFMKGVLNYKALEETLIKQKYINELTGKPYKLPNDYAQIVDEFDFILTLAPEIDNDTNKDILSMLTITALKKSSSRDTKTKESLSSYYRKKASTIFVPVPAPASMSIPVPVPAPAPVELYPQKQDNTLLWIGVFAFTIILVTILLIFLIRALRLRNETFSSSASKNAFNSASRLLKPKKIKFRK